MKSLEEYDLLLKKIIELVELKKISDVNKYYRIGELIKQNGKEVGRGSNIIERLSKDLLEKCGKGFSISNLSNMQQFYQKYRNVPVLYKYAEKLEWNKNITLLSIYDLKETEYYLKFASNEKMSNSSLKKKIDEGAYDEYIKTVEDDNYKIEIKKIRIQNYKSLVDIEIRKPSRFSVFAGANSCGKSNILEALEFLFHSRKINGKEVFNVFGGEEGVLNYNEQLKKNKNLFINIELSDLTNFTLKYDGKELQNDFSVSEKLNEQFYYSFTRLFIEKSKRSESKLKSPDKLWFDASNISNILKNILIDTNKKEDILDWLKLFIPGLSNIEIKTDNLSGKEELLIFEKDSDKPFTGNLISDGTNNIIALLTLIYQGDHPKFLCIEEPENGLNPKVIKEFVKLFRRICEEEGHYIWLSTHSQTVVSELISDELIIVDKQDGKTHIKQFSGQKFDNISMDEAWLNNILDGGLPW
ncbi:MAG: AAA family ATPase [Bacteroidota bacterium]